MSKLKKLQNSEKEKIYQGSITIFYKKENNEILFLIAKNTKTGNISFVSGAKEDFEEDLIETAQRENLEELGLSPDRYKLQKINVKHEFIFGKNKKERAGHKGNYQVFISDLTEYDSKISHTKELLEINWLNKKEVLKLLTFPDVKEIFQQTLNLINS